MVKVYIRLEADDFIPHIYVGCSVVRGIQNNFKYLREYIVVLIPAPIVIYNTKKFLNKNFRV